MGVCSRAFAAFSATCEAAGDEALHVGGAAADRDCRRASTSRKGSDVQAWPSTGTTSVWPDSTMPGTSAGPMVAQRLAFRPSSL